MCLHWVFVEAHEIFKNWLINDLLWGTLGLCCCVQVFSNYGVWGLTLSLWSMGFSLWWLLSLLKPQALGSWVSVAEGMQTLWLWLVGSRTWAQ